MGLLGDINRAIFGGSKKKEESGNLNNEFLLDNYGASGAGAFQNSLGGLQSTLGSNPQQFWDQGGGQFLLDQGVQGINNNMYARGLGKSGAAMKALEQFRSGLASTYLDNWLNHMTDLGKLGLGAGGLVAEGGKYGESKGTSDTGGLGKFIGAIMASDRSLKTDIEEIGPWDDRGDGLKRYRFRYKSDPSRTAHEGVMADEVKRLRPWAYVPDFTADGKAGVNYAALGEAA